MAHGGREGAPTKAELGERKSQRQRRKPPRPCPLCGTEVRFTWQCPCGFELCQSCMDENVWGLSCNNITWVCPECGKANSF